MTFGKRNETQSAVFGSFENHFPTEVPFLHDNPFPTYWISVLRTKDFRTAVAQKITIFKLCAPEDF